MIILGIDPGITRMGYGVIKKTSGLEVVGFGVVGDDRKSHEDRLSVIGEGLSKIIDKHRPDFVGVEKLYFTKNKKTAISVSEARGVILFLLNNAGVPVFEFTPSDIKSVVAGDGSCSKTALAKIVCLTLGIESVPGPDDVSDALAVAIRTSFEVGRREVSSN